VTITSAGCNVLNYLLFDPARIDAVDLNPHQTALLELKVAAIRTLKYEDFFSMFGTGRINHHREIYGRLLRPLLSVNSRRIWDRRINYFHEQGRGLYFNGLAGTFARLINLYIDQRRGLRGDLGYFLNIDDLQHQAMIYRTRIAPQLWSAPIRWLLSRKAILLMLGVPDGQIQEMRSSGIANIASFIQERLDHLFSCVPIRTNYFWRVYLEGCYSTDCCPPYLRANNFEVLRERVHRIHMHTMSVSDFLRFTGQRFSVYVLLDHMDWMQGNTTALREEWRLILSTATRAARIIFRSGGLAFTVPEFAQQRLRFHSELTRSLHLQDRVGTYGSFYFATLGGQYP
jgi:S-adenosylmethionine-diacylglycerol 3-amino-3-carboxypropyl transferase